ncbi:glycosyltransferase family 2 protein [Candidatus Woesebacteria bacterium]|nr:glycosyltransferase family 2 protein [Candidatus Woesebacteria bacterium]
MTKNKLSIVIVSYNTKELLDNCLRSVYKEEKEVPFEVIVVDNASSDGSVEMVNKKYPQVILIKNSENLGFSKANNKARLKVKTPYVLFLNSDTLIYNNTLKKPLKYLEDHKRAGSITCKTVLKNGQLDKDVRRSFPTPWVALTHLVFRLDRIFPRSKLFAKYWYGYFDEDKLHEVDVIQGAFHLTRKEVLDEVGWFDEDYFLDGEDIDLCWRIKQAGWKIIYYPKVKITHYKKASKNRPSIEERKKIISKGVESMELFYRKRLWDRYPLFLNLIIVAAVRITKQIRLFRIEFIK